MSGQGPTSDTPSIFDDEDTGSGRGVIRIASVAALGGLLFGYDSAVINGAVKSIEDHFRVDSLTLGLAVASALLGAAAEGRPKVQQADEGHEAVALESVAVALQVQPQAAAHAAADQPPYTRAHDE